MTPTTEQTKAYKRERDLNSLAMRFDATKRAGMDPQAIFEASDIDMVISMKNHGMTINTTHGVIDIAPGWIADYLANCVRVAMRNFTEEVEWQQTGQRHKKAAA